MVGIQWNLTTYVIDQGTGLVKEGHVAVGPSSWDMIIDSRAFRGRKEL